MNVHKEGHGLKKILFITPVVKRFRVPFFIHLHQELLTQGVALRVLYSDPEALEKTKEDSVDLPLHVGKKIARCSCLHGRMILQYIPFKEIMHSDLIVIVNSNRFLINYPLIVLSLLGLKKVALWGHAYNHQGDCETIREKFKAAMVNKVDWWFVYSKRERHYLIEKKMPESSITVIENAIDTSELCRQIQSLSQESVGRFRDRFWIPSGSTVALYCGSLYEKKKILFLLDAADRIRKSIPGFVLLVIGAGPDSDLMRERAASCPWIKYEGAMFGFDKAIAYHIADVVLNPGLVGLGILDCFAAGLPFITTDVDLHSPEIEYLKHGENGLMLPFDVGPFSDQVSSLMLDQEALHHLKQGAEEMGHRVTLENMIDNVSQGVVSAISIS